MHTGLKILFSSVLVLMGYKVISTSMESNLFEQWNYLAGIPWMRATLWDFYANVLVLSLWVCYKESKLWKKVMWVILMAVFGSIGTCAYLLVQLFNLKKGQSIKELLISRN